MTDGWRALTMRDVIAEFYDGPHATPSPATEGAVYLGIKNMTEDGHLDLSDVRHIADGDYPNWTRRVEPRPGDLVFTYEATLHRYAILPPGFRGTLGRRVALLRPRADVVDTRFLLYWFIGPEWRRTVQSRINVGSTVDRLPLTDFPTFPLRLPSMGSQRKIASILSAYDDLIENNNRRIRILEEMAQAIYREWFVEFRYPGHERVPLVDSELGPIPEGWSIRMLSMLARITMGQSPPSAAYNRKGIGLPFHQGVGTYGTHYPVHQVHSTSGLRIAEPGDTLVSVRAPVGRINIADRRLILGRGVCAVGSGGAPNGFLLHALKDVFREEDAMGNGSIFKAVTRGDMERIPVRWPGDEHARRFGDTVAPMWELIGGLTIGVGNLRAARDLLLPRLISGEIDVSDLDIDTSGLVA